MPQLTLQDAYQLALVRHRAGDVREAESLYRQILAIAPAHHNARIDLGTALRQQGRFEEALVELRQVLAIRPDLPEVHAALGNFYLARRQNTEAVAAFRAALQLFPNNVIARNNLGRSLQEMGELDAAISEYRSALDVDPGFIDAQLNIGTAHWEKGMFAEAQRAYESTLLLNPADARARMDQGILRLLQGDYRRGWDDFEARRQVLEPSFVPPRGQPLWDGSDLNGGTILLHDEQGLGDTIQFVRYVPMVRVRGGRVILRCQKELARLLRGRLGIERIISREDAVPDFDVYCPLASLPRVFGTDGTSIPADVPYLSPDPELVSGWQSRLSEVGPGLKVGLVWAGNPENPRDRVRSLPADTVSSLLGVDEVRWVSLQKGTGAASTGPIAGKRNVIDWTGELRDFADTAALVAALDLVVSVDTSVAHLAGALGKPVWLLLPFVPDWRWLLDREVSPWYPTMRLFRQSIRGHWAQPIERLRRELQAMAHR